MISFRACLKTFSNIHIAYGHTCVKDETTHSKNRHQIEIGAAKLEEGRKGMGLWEWFISTFKKNIYIGGKNGSKHSIRSRQTDGRTHRHLLSYPCSSCLFEMFHNNNKKITLFCTFLRCQWLLSFVSRSPPTVGRSSYYNIITKQMTTVRKEQTHGGHKA